MVPGWLVTEPRASSLPFASKTPHIMWEPLPRARPRASVIFLTVHDWFFALPTLLVASRSKRTALVEVLGLCTMKLSLER